MEEEKIKRKDSNIWKVPSIKRVLNEDYPFLYIAVFEFISTMFVIFLQAGSVQVQFYTGLDITLVALSHGFSFYVANSVFNILRSGYTNPLLAISYYLVNMIENGNYRNNIMKLISLIIIEFLASISGAAVVLGIMGDRGGFELGTPAIPSGIALNQAIGFEIFGSFIFYFFVLFANISFDFQPDRALIGGFLVSILNYVGLSFSGASLNYVRHFGPAVVGNAFRTTDWIYYVGPTVGWIGALIFYLIFLYATVSDDYIYSNENLSKRKSAKPKNKKDK